METNSVLSYLRSISSCPELYDHWATYNDRLFDGVLKPLPIVIALSNYGRAGGFCAMDHIGIQPRVYASAMGRGLIDEVIRLLIHEMCHQADDAEGLSYEPLGRVQNIHNSWTWCNRINSVMERLGDKRFATPYKRNRKGEMVAMSEAPAGLELIPYEGLKEWEPAVSLR